MVQIANERNIFYRVQMSEIQNQKDADKGNGGSLNKSSGPSEPIPQSTLDKTNGKLYSKY